MKFNIYCDNIDYSFIVMHKNRFKSSKYYRFNWKMNFSCRDPVSASNMKKNNEELIIFDRFIDIESKCEIHKYWKGNSTRIIEFS